MGLTVKVSITKSQNSISNEISSVSFVLSQLQKLRTAFNMTRGLSFVDVLSICIGVKQNFLHAYKVLDTEHSGLSDNREMHNVCAT